LAKYLYGGNNIYSLDRHSTAEAIEKLSDTIHVDLKEAKVTGLEFGTQFVMRKPPDEYFKKLGDMPKLLRYHFEVGTLYYKSKGKMHPKTFCFYDKKADAAAKGMALPVGFDELTKAGSMMGSGGMIIMDEDTCMVDVARYFMEFLTDESCGKCVPCREGMRQMLKILTNITKGKGKDGDIELLEQLAETAKEAALCALGKSSPNPFLSTLQHFRSEYDAHVKEKRCPALSCKELINFYIDPEKCQGCGTCAKKCPSEAIIGGKSMIHIVDQEKCTKCGTCFEACPPRLARSGKFPVRLFLLRSLKKIEL